MLPASQIWYVGDHIECHARLNVPLKLTAGGAVATVTVTADASLLNTESGSEGQVLTTQQLQSLPVSGANTFQFMEIAPGVQSENSQTYSMGRHARCGTASRTFSGQAGVIGAETNTAWMARPMRGNQQRQRHQPCGRRSGASRKMDVSGFDASVGHSGRNLDHANDQEREPTIFTARCARCTKTAAGQRCSTSRG